MVTDTSYQPTLKDKRTLLSFAAKAAGYGLPGADDHDEIGRQYEYQPWLMGKAPVGVGLVSPAFRRRRRAAVGS